MSQDVLEKDALDLDEDALERARRVFALLGDPGQDDSDTW